MRIVRVAAAVAIGLAVTAAPIAAAPIAARADEIPSSEPPVVAPPPVVVSPPAPPTAPPTVTPPPVTPPPPPNAAPTPPATSPAPHVETADEELLRLTGMTRAEANARISAQGQAQLQALVSQYGGAPTQYLLSHPGSQLSYDHATGVFTDPTTGQVVDITSIDAAVATPADGTEGFGTAFSAPATEHVSAVFEPVVASVETAEPTDAPSKTLTATPAADGSSTTIAASAGWIAIAALALWRKRHRAYELLTRARGAAAL